ncbi:MAG: hypothetical protein ACOCG5_07465 [Candidatus Alkaliphilus sp. MAG34]|nr:hypothetical protein [Clostridiales bacterium]
MNQFKKILSNSVIYQIICYIKDTYNNSYFKNAVEFICTSYKNSYVMGLILGKRNYDSFYENSVFYRIIQRTIKMLDRTFLWLSSIYVTAKNGSVFIGTIKCIIENSVNNTFKALRILFAGFSIGFLFFNPSIYALAAAGILQLVLFILDSKKVCIAEISKTSYTARIFKYFVE